MGLASALGTALTGMSAAETSIDVIGNNLANSNTVGFKASTANFATQFLQTMTLGSSPSANNGGTDPEQTGLGTIVSSISPNFSQGTISTSSTPSNLAIQGEGMFIMQGSGGQRLYTRDGEFKMNAGNQLVNSGGYTVLGYGVDNQFHIDSTTLRPLSIPLGTATVAQATQNVILEGALPPTGQLANRGVDSRERRPRRRPVLRPRRRSHGGQRRRRHGRPRRVSILHNLHQQRDRREPSQPHRPADHAHQRQQHHGDSSSRRQHGRPGAMEQRQHLPQRLDRSEHLPSGQHDHRTWNVSEFQLISPSSVTVPQAQRNILP